MRTLRTLLYKDHHHMALFVFNWSKREYILTALWLILLVLTVKHQEFFLCKEKPLTSFERFCVWLGVMEKPQPCPGVEDLYTMAIEMGVASTGVMASCLLPSLWNCTSSLLGAGIRGIRKIPPCITGIGQSIKGSIQTIGRAISDSVKGGFQFLKDRVWFRNCANDERRPEFKYFFFRNAYAQRARGVHDCKKKRAIQRNLHEKSKNKEDGVRASLPQGILDPIMPWGCVGMGW